MFEWLKKKSPLAPPPKKEGFFSTHNDFGLQSLETDQQKLQDILNRSFPRKMSDLRLTTKDGQIVTMDEAWPGLQTVKIQNALGANVPLQQLAWYAAQGFIGYQTAAMLSQQWLINKACTVPARDAVRHGYHLSVNDGTNVKPEVLDFIRMRDKEMKVKQNCTELLRMGRIFGIRVALFKVKSRDPLYYEKPFNIDGITPGSYQGITQIDPYWIAPELDAEAAGDPMSMHFYEPTWWFVNGKRIHRTHLVIMKNMGEVPDILKPTYFYGGIPLPQMIFERVYAAERTANEAPLLAMSKRLTVLNVDISQAMADEQKFAEKMNLWSLIQNNFGVKVVGESEEIKQFDTTLADLDAVIMTQYQLVAAIAETPATKLLGTSPKGFGASGEYEESSYHEMLESLQEHDCTPLVDRHHALLMRSEVVPEFGIKPFQIEHVWKPTDTPTAKEQAEINKTKADTDNVLVQAGSIDGLDSRRRIIDDPDSGYNGIAEVVPGGPGDREAMQQAELADQGALEAPVTERRSAKDWGIDGASGDFDPAKGQWNGARLITHQRFLNDAKVLDKIKNRDFVVNVTPEWEEHGNKYRMIIDGHHSLVAAMIAKVAPVFIEKIPLSEVFNAATREATDGNTPPADRP